MDDHSGDYRLKHHNLICDLCNVFITVSFFDKKFISSKN